MHFYSFDIKFYDLNFSTIFKLRLKKKSVGKIQMALHKSSVNKTFGTKINVTEGFETRRALFGTTKVRSIISRSSFNLLKGKNK